MRKKMILLLATLLILISVFVFSGCTPTPSKVSYMNETISVENINIEVTDIMISPYMNGAYNDDQFTLTNGGNYVFIKISVQNNGTNDITFGGNSCDYQLLFDIGRYALEPNAFSQNEHLTKRIPSWQPQRSMGANGEHYYDDIIFEHSNGDTNIVKANSERQFMTGFITSAKTLEEYANQMVIHKNKGVFSKEEIQRVVLEKRENVSSANKPVFALD